MIFRNIWNWLSLLFCLPELSDGSYLLISDQCVKVCSKFILKNLACYPPLKVSWSRKLFQWYKKIIIIMIKVKKINLKLPVGGQILHIPVDTVYFIELVLCNILASVGTSDFLFSSNVLVCTINLLSFYKPRCFFIFEILISEGVVIEYLYIFIFLLVFSVDLTHSLPLFQSSNAESDTGGSMLKTKNNVS